MDVEILSRLQFAGTGILWIVPALNALAVLNIPRAMHL